MAAIISQTAFSPYRELEAYQALHGDRAGRFGATTIFVGTMRDFNLDSPVSRMFLEYYPKMTENVLGKIVDEAKCRWDILDVLVIHRVGEIYPDDAIVLIAVWASHRAEAFEACRYILEELKHNAPFWKKETSVNGERWVERNT